MGGDDLALNDNIYEGVSKILFSECCHRGSLLKTIKGDILPTLLNTGKKNIFSGFDITFKDGDKEHFNTLSELIEAYIDKALNVANVNAEEMLAKDYCVKEIDKAKAKLAKQELEYNAALDYKHLEKEAQLLASNIHLVKPYQESITVMDYESGEKISLPLNTKISPSENVNYYFNRVKKQKRTIEALSEQMEITKDEISYYETLLNQISFATNSSLKEISKEIGIAKQDKRNLKPAITRYLTNDGYNIYVGKNNTQNNYLSNKLAKPTDYFFHVAAHPGCHVIYNGPLNDDAIKLASSICVLHSKQSGIMAVDYVQVKYLKKVKGMPRSFVTYTNQHTTHVSADIAFINQNAKLQN